MSTARRISQGANASPAVRQQRHASREGMDDFPTPPWATRALCDWLTRRGHPLHLLHAWEPACNRGFMARPLAEYFDNVFATDAASYGWDGQDGVVDFLIDWDGDAPDVDWIITNPPFKLAEPFIAQALSQTKTGVAMFARSALAEGETRYANLFMRHRPSAVLQFSTRVVIYGGACLDPDVPITKPDGSIGKPTSATAFSWFIWTKPAPRRTEFDWIPPCRADLTRPGDYPPVPDHLSAPSEGTLL